MKRELEPVGRKKKPQRGQHRGYFDDEGFNPSKKDSLNQYKRKQKHRNNQNWDE